ncbi:OLC1v1030390C1 [Oldenlandia corymbosa var. corymbosa]|uniref:OLC1v1030390C1 n=1 Tax=Oldenlandia corymbosa var. corymbosa TaxID=529605 RepID=A0AAV1CFY2_OLDCO|nr:OLC1v1030390C1 [Oldenlandia corymbosa var. corymbosa]
MLLRNYGQDSSVSDNVVLPMYQGIMFHGSMNNCPVCGGSLMYNSKEYYCKGEFNEWSSWTYATKDPPRKDEPLKIPESVETEDQPLSWSDSNSMNNCPVCGGSLMYNSKEYYCKGEFNEWSSWTYATKDPPRKDEPLKIPESVEKSLVAEVIKTHEDPKNRPKRELKLADKPPAQKMIPYPVISHDHARRSGLTIPDSLVLAVLENDIYYGYWTGEETLLEFVQKLKSSPTAFETSYGFSIERIFAVELGRSPFLEEISKQPNKDHPSPFLVHHVTTVSSQLRVARPPVKG